MHPDAFDLQVMREMDREGRSPAPGSENRCPPGCKGIDLGDGNHSGCSCAEGKLANGAPAPAGFRCDCPNHPGSATVPEPAKRWRLTTRCGTCGARVVVEFEPAHRAMAIHAAAAAAGLHESVCGGVVATMELPA